MSPASWTLCPRREGVLLWGVARAVLTPRAPSYVMVGSRGLRRARLAAALVRDRLLPSYRRAGAPSRLADLRVTPPPGALPRDLEAVARLHLDHRFDLLGSGWVRNGLGVGGPGFEGISFEAARAGGTGRPQLEPYRRVNPANAAESRRLWNLVSPGYEPLDWQVDIRSGYRWSERTWYRLVRRAPSPLGADLKLPWELGRMSHLPLLARAYASAARQRGSGHAPDTWRSEYRNQLLDFCAANPPRFGVQWVSPMDVAIRAVNVIVSHNLFRAAGASFDDEFEAVVARSMMEHGAHIVENLEWTPTARGNHYLANVVGLAFVAASLPSAPGSDAWLALSAQELIGEIERQFLADGSNFESSTYYHCLSTEMVIRGVALLLGLPENRLARLEKQGPRRFRAGPELRPPPRELRESLVRVGPKLDRMTRFVRDVMKPNGRIHQVGDTDSGSMLRLDPVYAGSLVGEAGGPPQWTTDGSQVGEPAPGGPILDPLNPSEVVDAADALITSSVAAAARSSYGGGFMSALAAGQRLDAAAPSVRPPVRSEDATSSAEFGRLLDRLSPLEQVRYEIDLPLGPDYRDSVRRIAYPEFGLYIFRGDDLYLAVRCGRYALNGTGGHAHNDQLALELNVAGEDWIADPGAYVYGAVPQLRNRYRSVRSHFAPQVEGAEPSPLDRGIFRLPDHAGGRCLYFGPEGFIGTHRGYGAPVHRVVRLETESIVVSDHADAELLLTPIALDEAPAFSPGYGSLLADPGIRADRIRIRKCDDFEG